VKWRTIGYFRFFFAPLPESAKYCRGLRLKGARSANAPKFILFSDTLDGGLLDSALTRLAQPISAPMTVQLGFQLFGK
jgi:hypothetical protein